MCAILGFTSPSLKKEQVLPYFEKTKSRGPDDTRLEPAGSGMLGFHRLAIMGLHPEGMQPFRRGGDMAVCILNGEFTVKYVDIEPDHVTLRPANDHYPPILVTEADSFEVWGVVTFVIKRTLRRGGAR